MGASRRTALGGGTRGDRHYCWHDPLRRVLRLHHGVCHSAPDDANEASDEAAEHGSLWPAFGLDADRIMGRCDRFVSIYIDADMENRRSGPEGEGTKICTTNFLFYRVQFCMRDGLCLLGDASDGPQLFYGICDRECRE